METIIFRGFPSERNRRAGPRPPYATSTISSITACMAATPPCTGVQVTSKPSSSQRPRCVAAAQERSSTPNVGPEPAANLIGNFFMVSPLYPGGYE